MFVGRRRPLLATAAVVGVAGASARHSVRKEEERNASAQANAEMEYERRRREDEDRERRTQMAIDEALAKERSMNQPGAPSADPRYAELEARNAQLEAEARYAREAELRYGQSGYSRDPAPMPPPPRADGLPAYRDTEQKTGGTRYCSECGNLCQRGDKFCPRCGQQQPMD
jgi:hypothetical protein